MCPVHFVSVVMTSVSCDLNLHRVRGLGRLSVLMKTPLRRSFTLNHNTTLSCQTHTGVWNNEGDETRQTPVMWDDKHLDSLGLFSHIVATETLRVARKAGKVNASCI